MSRDQIVEPAELSNPKSESFANLHVHRADSGGSPVYLSLLAKSLATRYGLAQYSSQDLIINC